MCGCRLSLQFLYALKTPPEPDKRLKNEWWKKNGNGNHGLELCKVVFAWMEWMRVNCDCNSKWPTASSHTPMRNGDERAHKCSNNKTIINWLFNGAIVDCCEWQCIGSIAIEPQEIHVQHMPDCFAVQWILRPIGVFDWSRAPTPTNSKREFEFNLIFDWANGCNSPVMLHLRWSRVRCGATLYYSFRGRVICGEGERRSCCNRILTLINSFVGTNKCIIRLKGGCTPLCLCVYCSRAPM